MKNQLVIAFALIILSALELKAQDKIYKTNGEVLETIVTEIGSSEIKYQVFDNLDGPIYVLNKNQIVKITYRNGITESFVKRAQNVFVEFLGQGIFLTANYDTRFGKRRNGIGGRVGVGAIGGGAVSFVSVPASLNYLFGNGKHFFEVGIGVTYANFSTNDEFFLGRSTNINILGTTAFMYRLQPENSGFSFRGGLTPIVIGGNLDFEFGGISVGYTF